MRYFVITTRIAPAWRRQIHHREPLLSLYPIRYFPTSSQWLLHRDNSSYIRHLEGQHLRFTVFGFYRPTQNTWEPERWQGQYSTISILPLDPHDYLKLCKLLHQVPVDYLLSEPYTKIYYIQSHI